MDELPPSVLQVLHAMTLPDPRPPAAFDSPAAAICRRLPSVSAVEVVDILHTLKALGLITIPYVTGTTTPAATADLTKWITEEGWATLGVRSFSSTN
jgi:hypothetical protein